MTDAASERTESAYFEFMGFDHDNARNVLGFYTGYFSEGPIVELACGHGVFLDLLRDAGLRAVGVDLDAGMVARCRAAGHEVVLADAISYLGGLSDASIGGLFAAHFLEHLPPEQAQTVYSEAARVLRPGCSFIAVVPSAECLSVLTIDFWSDPTHVRFYDPRALKFFASQAGLAVTESGGNPRNHPGAPPWLRLPPPTTHSDLRAEVNSLGQRAAASFGRAPERTTWWDRVKQLSPAKRSTHAQFPSEVGDLISLLADRIQAIEHDLATAHSTYQRFVAHLYPPNEVYVIARRPTDDDPDDNRSTSGIASGGGPETSPG